MVSYCAGLASVYNITVGKFVLTFLSASVLYKCIYFSSFVQTVVSFICYNSYFSYKHKRQRLQNSFDSSVSFLCLTWLNNYL